MANNFSRTLRALDADGSRRWAVRSVLAAVLLALWALWFFGARVTVYAVSSEARTEVDAQVYPVEAPVSGRIVRLDRGLDAEVAEGQILVELEADEQRLRLAEARAEIEGLSAQISTLQSELAGKQAALGQFAAGQRADLAEARSRLDAAERQYELLLAKAEEQQRLLADGLVPAGDLRDAQSAADQQRATVEELRNAVQRLQFDRQGDATTREAEVDALLREAAELEGERSAESARAARLERELELRSIRAPVAGRLGEVEPLREGAFLDAGDRVASVVPAGGIRVVGEFEPAVAVGRIRTGQSARLRLAAFPATRHGTIPVRVSRVGSEPGIRGVRVELDVATDTPSVRLEHGLKGTVEVEVERLSPAALVLRAAGKLLEGRRGAGAGERRASLR